MAATEMEDEDAWLYGDDYVASSKVKEHGVVNSNEERPSTPALDELDDALVTASTLPQPATRITSTANNLQPKAATPTEEAKALEKLDQKEEEGERVGAKGTAEEEDAEEEEESESDDEDDVQIHIGPIETQPPPFYSGRMPIAPTTPLTGPKTVDLETVPHIGGQSLYEIDLDAADKPWKLPGADITDYFNYGFTEETWKLYCDKQRKMKNEVAQLNKIAVHTTRAITLPKATSTLSTIPSIGAPPTLQPPPIPTFPPAGLPLPSHPLLPPRLPPFPTAPLGPVSENEALQELSKGSQEQMDERGKTPDAAAKEEEGSDGRATPGVDQDVADMVPPGGKPPLLPPPPSSLPPPPFSMPPPIRTSAGATGQDVANAMAAMLGSLRPPDHPFPNFPLPPGLPPPFPPQIPGSDFRHRVPHFPGGPPPPFPLLPGGPLDVPGMLPPPLDERGLPLHPDLGLPGGPGGHWDPTMGPPPPEFFELMRREGGDYPRGSRSPSRSGSSARSRSRSRSSSYEDRSRGSRRRDKRSRRHSRSRSHSRDRDRHGRSSRRHRTTHHRDRHDRDRERDREREREREKERERERERRRREERSRRERTRRHRSSSRDHEDDRSGGGGTSSSRRDRKPKDSNREERSHSQTPG